jgi:TolB protein
MLRPSYLLSLALLLPAILVAQPPGQITFVSSREGQFNKIWVMNANGSAQTQLSFGAGNETDPAWSPDGEHIVFVSNPVPGSDGTYVALLDRRGGVPRNITAEPGAYRHPQFSPDGRQILFSKRGDNATELFIIDVGGGEARHLPMPLAVDAGDMVSFDQPTWAPGGRTIAFWVWRQSELQSPDNGNVYRADIDGQHLALLTDGMGRNRDPAWSPDGTRIAFYGDRPEGAGIFLINADGGRPTLLPSSKAIGSPSWAPDSGWLTFVSTRDGNQDIFIMRADGSEAVNLTQGIPQADHSPAWSPASLPSIPTATEGPSWGQVKQAPSPGFIRWH